MAVRTRRLEHGCADARKSRNAAADDWRCSGALRLARSSAAMRAYFGDCSERTAGTVSPIIDEAWCSTGLTSCTLPSGRAFASA